MLRDFKRQVQPGKSRTLFECSTVRKACSYVKQIAVLAHGEIQMRSPAWPKGDVHVMDRPRFTRSSFNPNSAAMVREICETSIVWSALRK